MSGVLECSEASSGVFVWGVSWVVDLVVAVRAWYVRALCGASVLRGWVLCWHRGRLVAGSFLMVDIERSVDVDGRDR